MAAVRPDEAEAARLLDEEEAARLRDEEETASLAEEETAVAAAVYPPLNDEVARRQRNEDAMTANFSAMAAAQTSLTRTVQENLRESSARDRENSARNVMAPPVHETPKGGKKCFNQSELDHIFEVRTNRYKQTKTTIKGRKDAVRIQDLQCGRFGALQNLLWKRRVWEGKESLYFQRTRAFNAHPRDGGGHALHALSWFCFSRVEECTQKVFPQQYHAVPSTAHDRYQMAEFGREQEEGTAGAGARVESGGLGRGIEAFFPRPGKQIVVPKKKRRRVVVPRQRRCRILQTNRQRRWRVLPKKRLRPRLLDEQAATAAAAAASLAKEKGEYLVRRCGDVRCFRMDHSFSGGKGDVMVSGVVGVVLSVRRRAVGKTRSVFPGDRKGLFYSLLLVNSLRLLAENGEPTVLVTTLRL